MVNHKQTEKMSKTWKDRLVSALISLSVMIVASFIIAASQNRYDEKTTLKDKVEQIDREKASVTYVDKEILKLERHTDEKFELLLDEIRLNRQAIKEISR